MHTTHTDTFSAYSNLQKSYLFTASWSSAIAGAVELIRFYKFAHLLIKIMYLLAPDPQLAAFLLNGDYKAVPLNCSSLN